LPPTASALAHSSSLAALSHVLRIESAPSQPVGESSTFRIPLTFGVNEWTPSGAPVDAAAQLDEKFGQSCEESPVACATRSCAPLPVKVSAWPGHESTACAGASSICRANSPAALAFTPSANTK
jgi:hypothetical protein